MKKIMVLIGCILASAYLFPDIARAESRRILMVVTSANRINAEKSTGLWLEEFSVPYLLFKKAGFEVNVASPKGGDAPIDPRSQTDAAKVKSWEGASRALQDTARLDAVRAEGYDAIFIPGGHGAMFDLPGNGQLKELLRQFTTEGKVIAAVCHGPAGLVGATGKDGKPLVAGKTITAFTDDEERAMALDREMPFLLETKLREEGAKFVGGAKWGSHVEVDGRMVTGQNPASSAAAADAVIRLLK